MHIESKGNPTLIEAVIGGDTEMAKLLIERGADVNAVVTEGESIGLTPLMLAIKSGNTEMAKLLIIKDANFNAVVTEGGFIGITPFMLAIESRNTEIAAMLINRGADVNAVITEGDSIGLAPLTVAIESRNTEMAGLLINRGADANAVIPEGLFIGFTPLMLATQMHDTEMAELLIESGADANAVITEGSFIGLTPLTLAIKIGKTEIAELLINRGADANDAITEGSFIGLTPFMLATYMHNTEIAELLINRGADVNAVVTEGRFIGLTPLMLAIGTQERRGLGMEMAELLINRDANLLPENDFHKLSIELLEALAILFEQKAKLKLEKKQDSETNQALLATASAIILRIELYNRVNHKDEHVLEANAHDTSLAEQSLSAVKAYIDNHKEITIPSFEDAVIQIREMLVARIKNSEAEELVKTNLGIDPDSRTIFLNNFNRYDQDQLAFLWITSFQDSMPFINDAQQLAAMNEIKKMLPYIAACKSATVENGKPTSESNDIDLATSLQLSNLMQSNEGMMSCARGTPRGFRMIFDAFLSIKAPEQSQHEEVKHYAALIINNIMRDVFKAIDNKTLNNTDQTDQIAAVCEVLATIGSDNASNLLNGEVLEGRISGGAFNYKELHLRNFIMMKAYPTYEYFQNDVITNMKTPSGQQITLTNEDVAYLKLQYTAIANPEIREVLYDSLDAEQKRISKNQAIINAPEKIISAINKFRTDDNKILLKNTLNQLLGLMVGEVVELEKRDTVIGLFIENIGNLRIKLTPEDGKQILNQLKADYDSELKRPPPHRTM